MSWIALRVFVEMNSRAWSRYPSVDEAEQVVLAIASDEWDEERPCEWLGEHVAPEREW